MSDELGTKYHTYMHILVHTHTQRWGYGRDMGAAESTLNGHNWNNWSEETSEVPLDCNAKYKTNVQESIRT